MMEDCGCNKHHHHHHHHRRHRQVPVNRVTVDCTPVTFRTPGQAKNVLSCPVSQLSLCTTTQVVETQIPLPNGCVLNTPVAQTVQFPAICTVNTPPTLVPVPIITCPTTSLPIGTNPVVPCGCGT